MKDYDGYLEVLDEIERIEKDSMLRRCRPFFCNTAYVTYACVFCSFEFDLAGT